MDRKDILLLVVASGGGTPLTPVQLHKSLFMVSKNVKEIPDRFTHSSRTTTDHLISRFILTPIRWRTRVC